MSDPHKYLKPTDGCHTHEKRASKEFVHPGNSVTDHPHRHNPAFGGEVVSPRCHQQEIVKSAVSTHLPDDSVLLSQEVTQLSRAFSN
jgi:hypothetical protein